MFNIKSGNKWNGASKVIEETSELNVVLAKLMATNGNESYWGDVNLRDCLLDELGDSIAALSFFLAANFTDEEIDRAETRSSKKIILYSGWSEGKE